MSGSLSSSLSLLIADATQLENQISILQSSNSKEIGENIRLSAKIVVLENELLVANSRIAELEKILNKPPIPIPSPITPDVEIAFLDQTWRPAGEGELYPVSGERRWTWEPSPEVRIVLDCKLTQRRVIIERCWGDLPLTAPVLATHLRIALDGNEYYNSPVRVHHHTRPAVTFRRLPAVQFDLGLLKRTGIIPNYMNSATPAPQQLSDMVTGRVHTWKRWEQIKAAGTYDPFTEDYQFIINSWSGGAGPSINEASMLTPWDSTLLLSSESDSPTQSGLYDLCFDTADTSGNYPIHFWDQRGTVLANLPIVNPDAIPALFSSTGLKLPVPDLAHHHALSHLAALLTGERYYTEELESWVLLGPLARKGIDRESGIYFSGQVRATAWWLRIIYHLTRVPAPESLTRYYTDILLRNLQYIYDNFVDPQGSEYRSTGILSIVQIRPSESTKYASSNALFQTITGNTYFIAYVMGEISTHPNEQIRSLAIDIVRHVTLTARGTWEHSPSRYLIPWLQHAMLANVSDWPTIMKTTFSTGPAHPTKWGTAPVTIDYFAWWRASVCAAIDAGGDNLWAIEALKWADREIQKWRPLPIAWAVEPRSRRA